eukprot:501533-Prorocentrum_minimum.AAC.1
MEPRSHTLSVRYDRLLEEGLVEVLEVLGLYIEPELRRRRNYQCREFSAVFHRLPRHDRELFRVTITRVVRAL